MGVNMKVEVNLYASLARYLPDDSGRHTPCILEVKKGTTILQILRLLNIPLESVKLIFLNGIHARIEATLNEGDRLGVFPPVAGG